MDEQEQPGEEAEERQDDLELPDETAEDVKGGWDWIKSPSKLAPDKLK